MCSKTLRLLIVVATSVLVVAAAAFAVVRFKQEILELLTDIKSKIDSKRNNMLHREEFSDYADIDIEG